VQQKVNQRALAIAKRSVAVEKSITCERAQVIVAEYGFKDIKAELCAGKTFGFSAMRDGKPFSIKIVAVSGELAKVQRLR
jgi:hypothetical protein